jgi:hypothetical protein
MTPTRTPPMSSGKAPPVKRRTPGKRHISTREYSKIVLNAMIILWFVGALYGAVIVAVQVLRNSYSTDLSSLLMYIGGPMTGGVVSYLIKSSLENREKIKHSAELQSPAGNNYIP